jgi:hypothetical protein
MLFQPAGKGERLLWSLVLVKSAMPSSALAFGLEIPAVAVVCLFQMFLLPEKRVYKILWPIALREFAVRCAVLAFHPGLFVVTVVCLCQKSSRILIRNLTSPKANGES